MLCIYIFLPFEGSGQHFMIDSISLMAGMCCGVETKVSSKRRRLDVSSLKFVAADVTVASPDNGCKRQKRKKDILSRDFHDVLDDCLLVLYGESELESNLAISDTETEAAAVETREFGMTSVRGRRRDMEDAVAAHPSFYRRSDETTSDMHFFGVYDGHGCSHVAMKCKDRFHGIVKEELEGVGEIIWKELMDRSFSRMDREAVTVTSSNCKCELQTPMCDAVGSTAVVALITPEKIVVSNCGDSRAVLCRNAVATPLSSDHKPDRPDELNRIEKAGGRVIYWNGARVLGVLAMSRAIGDHYLKPFVISEPEVTVTERTTDDEFLILASDGLWDVVSNETACAVVRMCLLSENKSPSPAHLPGSQSVQALNGENSDKTCSDASIALTKLALARNSSDNVSVVVVNLRRPL